MKTRILFLFALLSAAVANVQSVPAATITVMNTNDSGAGSLRGALASALDGDTIDATGISGTITLTTGQLNVGTSVTIDGPGANMLAVDGNHAGRVFYIGSGKTVTIASLKIANGFALGGGGIYNDHATLTVNDCTISGNTADIGTFGGGILNNGTQSGSATLTINNSTLSGNSASNAAGGIYNAGNDSGSATLIINNSTLSGNSAANVGGIWNEGGSVGGSATAAIKNSTFSGNSGTNLAGSIFNHNGTNSGSATLNIGDTILKAGASGVNINSTGGTVTTVTSLGYNLSSDDASALLNQSTDQNSTDPKLGPLQDNGGPTFTHALCTATGVPDASCTGVSPAIDQGKNFTSATTDQRGSGFTRTVDLGFPKPTGGDGTDIGSFEVQASPAVCPQPQGYWKNNPGLWPVTSLTLGSQTYTKTELLTILKTRVGSGPRADASLILADQLIAAKLNIENGADEPAPVPATITDADAVLSLYTGKLPYRVRPNTTNGQRMVNDAATLESYNNGLLTTGCSP